MIDIHCHILPSMPGDDGASDDDTALNMLRLAQDEGIKEIICTPHWDEETDRNLICSVGTLSEKQKSVGITLHPGTEYKYSQQMKVDLKFLCLANTKFVLIDFCSGILPMSAENLAYEFRSAGYSLIAAHPERLFCNIKDIERLTSMGYYIQLTAGSLLGQFGAGPMKMAFQVIGMGKCHYIASDAHNMSRAFGMKECRELLDRYFGSKFTMLMFETNPERLLANKDPLSPIPHRLPVMKRLFVSLFHKI